MTSGHFSINSLVNLPPPQQEPRSTRTLITLAPVEDMCVGQRAPHTPGSQLLMFHLLRKLWRGGRLQHVYTLCLPG